MQVATEPVFSWPTRVYWEDTDAGGVVYHAQYLAFMERARTEWLRAQALGQEALRTQHDLVFAVRAMQVDYRAPARLDDALEVSVQLLACRRASLVLAQQVRRGAIVLVEARVRVAALSAAGFRPRPLPETVYQQLQSSA